MRAKLLAADGELHSVLMCVECSNRSIVLVTRPAGDPLGVKADLTPQEVETREVLRALARHLLRMAKAYRAVLPGQLAIDGQLSHDAFRVVGLETAADVAEAWAANPAARHLEVGA